MNASALFHTSEVEEILQDLKADDDEPHLEPIGDIQKLESLINDRYVYADIIITLNEPADVFSLFLGY